MDTATPNANYLRKVQGLLNQAEGTDNLNEQQIFLAAANRIMTERGISEAMLAAAGRGQDTLKEHRIRVSNPWATQKGLILRALTTDRGIKHYRSPIYENRNGRFMKTGYDYVVFGWGQDIDDVEFLFAGVLMHATREMLAADRGREHPKRFRNSFLIGYADRLSSRLAQNRAVTSQRNDQDHHLSSGSTALMLLDRESQTKAFYDERKPDDLRTGPGIRASSTNGVRAGASAGNRADLGGGRVGGGNAPLALNR